MATVWTQTKTWATIIDRVELGFGIYANTTTFAYECGTTNMGTYTTCGHTSSISLNFSDSPSNSPIQGGRYLVATFHTHTPLTYCLSIVSRQVGPSDTDISTANSSKTPGILYDYVSQYSGGIRGGHNIDAPATIYTFGPDRKTTPN
jgi:hypothetical protein